MNDPDLYSLFHFVEGQDGQHAVLVYLQMSPGDIVLLQAFLDSAEHLATVRTVNRGRSLIVLHTTVDLLAELVSFLDNLRDEITFTYIHFEEGFSGTDEC